VFEQNAIVFLMDAYGILNLPNLTGLGWELGIEIMNGTFTVSLVN
jgi:hypothetical protein